jgi:hypothetical protein
VIQVGSVSRNLTIGLIIADQLVAIAIVLAVVMVYDSLNGDAVVRALPAFLGFLAFSGLAVRRVARMRD